MNLPLMLLLAAIGVYVMYTLTSYFDYGGTCWSVAPPPPLPPRKPPAPPPEGDVEPIKIDVTIKVQYD